MKITTKTWLLLALVLGLGVANLIVLPAPAQEVVEIIPALMPEKVSRVEISTPLEKLVMQRGSMDKDNPEFSRWRILSPVQADADAAQITAMLRLFAPGIKLEARVDQGNLKNYGLEDQDAKLLELFTDGDVPTISVVVGRNAIGATSFIRLPGEDEVYRADVGGRGRYDRGAADWRNRQVLDLKPEEVSRFSLKRGTEVLNFVRGPSTETDKAGKLLPGDFVLEGSTFPVDAQLLDAIVNATSRVRAGAFQNPDYDGGFDAPSAELTLTMKDGSSHNLILGSRSNSEASFLKVDAIPDILRVSSQPARLLTLPLEAMRDRALLRFTRSDVSKISLVESGLTVVLQPVPDTEHWNVIQPANFDVDQRAAEQMLSILSEFRADGQAADNAFAPSGARIEVIYDDGHKSVIELGQSEKDQNGQLMVRMRVSGKEGIFLLKDVNVQALRHAFGRG